MTNHLSWETLNDVVDGRLTTTNQSQAESHLLACDDCRATLDVLRETLESARAMTDAVDPPAALWTDIRSTIEAGKVAPLATGAAPRRGWWVTMPRMAVAVLLLTAASSGITAIVMRSRVPDRLVLGGTVPSLPVAWQVTEHGYQASVLALREQLAAMRGDLAPATITAVEQSLATIDVAIAEAREALLRDPANAALPELLASNYRQKIELLRRATQLTSS